MTVEATTPSAYRNIVLADRIRNQLLEIYGRKCDKCGVSADDAHLEINHIYGRDWDIRTLNRYRRYLKYRQEAKQGKINLLCKDCNGGWRPRRNEQPPGRCPLYEAYLQSNRPF